MRYLAFLAVLALFAGGCVTQRTKVGAKRAQLYAADRGTKGDELGAAVAVEMAEVCVDIGADQVAPAEAPLNADAALANAKGIAVEREARQWFKDAALGVLDYAKTAWPPLGAALGLAGTALVLFRKLKSAGGLLVNAKNTIGAAVTLTQRVKEKVADGKFDVQDLKDIYTEAQLQGPAFVAGATDLKAEYDKLKAEWAADGTPIKSV